MGAIRALAPIEVEIYLVHFGSCDAKSFRFVQLEFLIYKNFDIYDFIENVINYNLINILVCIEKQG